MGGLAAVGSKQKVVVSSHGEPDYPLEHQLTYALVLVGVGTALGGLAWGVLWLYAPGYKADPGRLGGIGTMFGCLVGGLFLLWINVPEWLAIAGTLAVLAAILVGVRRRIA